MLSVYSSVAFSIYIVGIFLNFISLFVCCWKNNWKELDNIKYLNVTQVLFSVIAIASRLGIVFIEFLPQPFCGLLPIASVFSLSLALFNLAAFVVVIHAQLTSTWKLRFSSSLLIIVAVLVSSTAIEFPALYSAVKHLPVVWVTYDGPGCPNRILAKEVVPVGINVASYAFALVFLQLIIPGFIIINRLMLIGLCLLRADLKTTPATKLDKSSMSMTGERWVNILCQMVFVGFVFVFVAKVEDEAKTLDFVSHAFHVLSIAAVLVLCFNIALLDVRIVLNHKEKWQKDELSVIRPFPHTLKGKFRTTTVDSN